MPISYYTQAYRMMSYHILGYNIFVLVLTDVRI